MKTITCTFADPISPEYRWFAWYPVKTVDAGLRWLCIVWKRKYLPHSFLPGGLGTFFMYATKRGMSRDRSWGYLGEHLDD